MAQPRGVRLVILRVVTLLLLPFGLLCIAVPFYLLTLPDRGGIIDDTRAALGAGDAGRLKAAYVGCTRERSGSSSSRGIGMTEYACVIDLSEAPATVAPVPTGDRAAKPADKRGDPYAGLSYEAAMAKWNAAMAEQNRQNSAALDAYIARSRARSDVSNRIERKLAIDRSGQLPVVRILSATGEPRRIGLVWGFGELAWRWAGWLVISLIFFAFGGLILLVVKLAWWPRRVGVS